jgi:hypothetical protein
MIKMQQPLLARTEPITIGVVVVIAGAPQFTRWKASHLACCRESPGPGRTLSADAGTAWRHARPEAIEESVVGRFGPEGYRRNAALLRTEGFTTLIGRSTR